MKSCPILESCGISSPVALRPIETALIFTLILQKGPKRTIPHGSHSRRIRQTVEGEELSAHRGHRRVFARGCHQRRREADDVHKFERRESVEFGNHT